MHYRSESEGVPRVNVSIAFADKEWYMTLTWKATPMIQLEERTLVVTGMSMLWVPQNPRAYPVYAHKGKGYCLMNVFDPKVAGGMAVAALPEGEPGVGCSDKGQLIAPFQREHGYLYQFHVR
ncbi:hypothetical protein Hdeb2414_s0019g00543701 [Helianthus debilis subsp. tardiflorus]